MLGEIRHCFMKLYCHSERNSLYSYTIIEVYTCILLHKNHLHLCFFRRLSMKCILHIKTSPWPVTKQQLYHVSIAIDFFKFKPSLKHLTYLSNVFFTIKGFIDVFPYLLLTENGQTMTFIQRAQTFPNFLAHEPEEKGREQQEEATPPSSGCEESCNLSPLQWQSRSGIKRTIYPPL